MGTSRLEPLGGKLLRGLDLGQKVEPELELQEELVAASAGARDFA